MESNENELLLEALDILNSSESEEALREDDLICECMCVSVAMIRETMAYGHIDLCKLSDRYKMGSACSSCIKNFDSWKDRVL